MSNKKNIPFRAVRGTDEAIHRYGGDEGYLYFATDTRKTYLEVEDGKKILMGSDVEIFYGTKELPKDESGKPQNPEVFFHISEIQGGRLPLLNDLILNIDGCFYRVDKIVSAQNVRAQRLTLQGTGGGGGGTGPGGGTSSSFSITLNRLSYNFSSEADIMNIGVMGEIQNPGDNYLRSITVTLGSLEDIDLKGTKPFLEVYSDDEKLLNFNEVHNIDLAPHKKLFNTGATTITVAITDRYGERKRQSVDVSLITMALLQVENILVAATTDTLRFAIEMIGGTSNVTNKKLLYTFYREEDLEKDVLKLEYSLNINETNVIRKDLDLSSLQHGVYVVKIQAYASIAGTTDKIYSNTLTHKIGYFVEDTSPLLLVLPPETAQQFTNIPVQYLYVTNEVNKNYKLEIRVNNVYLQTINITSNTVGFYDFYFEDEGIKKIQFTVLETGASSSIELQLEPYTGKLPIIDLNKTELMLYLNPKGKTNNDIDREFWIDSKTRQYKANLHNVNYSSLDGWLVDPVTGDSYLRLISGASLDMPDFRPFSKDLVTGSKTDVSGMTIELDFEINGILDFSKPSISCVSTDLGGLPVVGFNIVGDQIKLYNSSLQGVAIDPEVKSALSNQTIVEGKRIKISFVIQENNGRIDFPMAYTYLNGKLTEAVKFDTTDRFIDNNIPGTLKVDSTYAQIKLYGIRFYSTALSEKEVLDNYTASLPTLQEKQKEFASNDVYNGDKISFDLVSSDTYDLQIPYMKLTGGYPSKSKDEKWVMGSGEPGLPTSKKDYRFVDIEVVYPKYKNGEQGLFSNYKDYSYKNEFSNGLGMESNAGNKASNGGAIMYCQGTSSMEYPVKNLRLRWKNKDNYFQVKPDLAPVEIICMKADYMESSGSHNTGAANLIDDLYFKAGMRTPGQDYGWDDEESSWKNDQRTVTCIKGHPCLIFYSPSGEPGTYEYIGKYNLNLDKATPEPFGFTHDETTNFGYLKDEEGNLVLDANGKKQNSIYCYEFLDNTAHPVCNFEFNTMADINGVVPTSYEETWYNTFEYKEPDGTLVRKSGWRAGFESRYPEDVEDAHGADTFYPLANWLNDLHYKRNGLGGYTGQANETEALELFAKDYWKYLDKDFLMAYYIITEALLMTDSRVKNMMIATWGPEWRFLMKDGSIAKIGKDGKKPSADNIKESYFGYIYYPIFYDMDTMLGLNNEGRVTFNYYAEDTDPTVFNGGDVLWNFVRDALPFEVNSAYSHLENSGLHAPEIIPYFNDNQANMANEAFYNGDADYKYITPARNGYDDLLNNEHIPAGAAPYLYALQGDRSLHREAFINNRMAFLRGKYVSAKFLAGDYVGFRWYTPVSNGGDLTSEDKYSTSAYFVEPDGKFTFTGLKTGYAGVQQGKNGKIYAHRFAPNSQLTFEVPTSTNTNNTESFLLGLSTLSDLGDLSNKYLGKFVISSTTNRLRKITLGNPHRYYYNKNWGSGSEQIIINSPTLEEFNLQNCSTYNRTIDFRDNPVIKKILMTGSSVKTVYFPENGVITELRLPNTFDTFNIIGHTSLTNENFSIGTYSYGPDNLIGGEGGKYVNNFSSLKYLQVVNTPIDTYDVLNGAQQLVSYDLQNINWNITSADAQYCKRSSNWTYIDEEGNTVSLKDKVPQGKFFTIKAIKDEDDLRIERFAYEPYEEEIYPTDGYTMLYEKVEMLDSNKLMTCIPMLERLLTLNDGTGYLPHKEALSGTIHINIPEARVIELDIYDKYKDFYPNIVITYGDNMEVEEANQINFYSGAADKDYVESVGGVQDLTPTKFALTAKDAHTLQELIGDYIPVKTQTISNTFEFTGQWVDWADANKTIYYQVVKGYPIPAGKEQYSFQVFKPSKDMELVPIFKPNVRKYKVTLYDYDGKALVLHDKDDNVIKQPVDVEYGASIGDSIAVKEVKYCYREYDGANPDGRFAFKGWQTKADYLAQSPIASIINLSTETCSADIGYYAFYKEEDAKETISMISKVDDFFDFKETSYAYEGNTYQGLGISIKDEFRHLLKGKISLPKEINYKGKQTAIIEISENGFSPKNSSNQIKPTLFTHIYFVGNNENSYFKIGSYAFSHNNSGLKMDSALEEVWLPTSVREISDHAFYRNSKLKFVQLNDFIEIINNAAFENCTNLTSLGLDQLPMALRTCGVSAFNDSNGALKATYLPENLTTLNQHSFAGCYNFNPSRFGSEINPLISLKSSNTLNNAGNNSVTDLVIYCQNGAIAAGAFSGYKTADPLNSVVIISPSGYEDHTTWGLKIGEATTVAHQVLSQGG